MLLGSLFSGIGGLEWGLEEAFADVTGLPVGTAWQAECNPYSRAVLTRHWPSTLRVNDVRRIGRGSEPVDLIAGGSPCQSISLAGRRKLLAPGAKSALWFEMARAIDELAPALVVWENVGGALCPKKDAAGLHPAPLVRVLLDLDDLGYDVVWTTATAAEVGASHRRLRVFALGMRRGARGVSRRPGDAAFAKVGPPLAMDRWTAPRHRTASQEEPPRSRPDSRMPYHMERIEALGNSVVPQVAYTLGVILAGLASPALGFPFDPRRARGLPGTVARRVLPAAEALQAGHGRKYADLDARPCATRKDPLCDTQPPLGAMVGGELFRPAAGASRPRATVCARDACDPEEAEHSMWPTATARDWRSGKSSASTRARNSRPLSEVAAPDGFLDPAWTDRHMGFGEDYTRAEGVTPRRRGKPPKSCT